MTAGASAKGRGRLLCALGCALAAPALALTVLASTASVTASGAVYLAGSWLIAVGLVLTPWRRKIALLLLLAGVIAITATAVTRIAMSEDSARRIRVTVLPAGASSRWVDRLVDEEDSALLGERAFRLIGGVTQHEHEDVAPALVTAYRQARSAAALFPSPVAGTYLGLQRPGAFDAVVVEPAGDRPAVTAVVFLHGFMGNLAIQCWEIAQAAGAIDAVTVCPSTNWVGNWRPAGEATVRATLAYLRARGVRRIYLGGYSNGGVGVGGLIPGLASEDGLRGLFFIAGTANAEGVRGARLPVLVLQGAGDERMPAPEAHRFAQEIGALASYVEVDADHFLIVKRPQLVQQALGAWLAKCEAGN